MRPIGFSTGALALSDFRRALEMLAGTSATAVELSALRQSELLPLVEALPELDLSNFDYVAFHAPSSLESSAELEVVQILMRVSDRGWNIIVHPNIIATPEAWIDLGKRLCIENMDKRKPIGQTANDLDKVFEVFPDASFCLDVGHARQVDPTMSEAAAMIHRFSDRVVQLHVSEVNSQSRHDPLTREAVLAIHRIAGTVPEHLPIIVESRVDEAHIEGELHHVLTSLDPEYMLAVAGD